MNFADIEKTWQSPQNAPSTVQMENDKMKFITDLRKRRRGSLLFITLIFAQLVFWTAKIAPHTAIDFTREWGVVPLFALPWIGWGALIYLHRRHRLRHGNYDRSFHASVAALLDDNRTELIRYKVIASLLVASVLILPLIVFQLRAVGKAGNEIVIPMLVIYPLYVVGALVWFVYNYRRRMLPRKLQLEALLHSYEQTKLSLGPSSS